jgi:DNA-binding CsgD family transcriptional regulator
MHHDKGPFDVACSSSCRCSPLIVEDGALLDVVRTLTPRQRQILALVINGQPSKNIAADLGISRRTVENHRASIMKKAGSTSLPMLVRKLFTTGLDRELGHEVASQD